MSEHLRGARLIRIATLALPAGPVRERYRREFLADLGGLARRARLAFALGVLTNALALRAAIGADGVPLAERDFSSVRKPVLCRLHLHFRVRCVAEDGSVYHRCRRCGDDQYEYERHRDENNVAGNVAGNIIGGPGGSNSW
jgi:hypothetical protein